MGWMSTMPPAHCNIDCKNDPNNCMSETFYKKIADILGMSIKLSHFLSKQLEKLFLVTKGFRDVGYTYVYIDDCWMSMNRSVDGKLVANPELFPSGMNNLSQYVKNFIILLKFLFVDA
jgi:alpha-N-acetylgalactosaminidase